jgi:hypothetical protein
LLLDLSRVDETPDAEKEEALLPSCCDPRRDAVKVVRLRDTVCVHMDDPFILSEREAAVAGASHRERTRESATTHDGELQELSIALKDSCGRRAWSVIVDDDDLISAVEVLSCETCETTREPRGLSVKRDEDSEHIDRSSLIFGREETASDAHSSKHEMLGSLNARHTPRRHHRGHLLPL